MKLGIAFAVVAIGCVDESEPTQTIEQPTISYRQDIQPIWDRWCVRCHNFHTPHLTTAESATELAGTSWRNCDGPRGKARFVVPGDPAKSYLLYKLTLDNTNDYDATACGRAMPADQGGVDVPLVQLDPDAVARIRTWIEEGARFD